MKSYRLSTPANNDVLEILSYLTALNPNAASRLAEDLFKEFRYLAEWPSSGRERLDLSNAPVRTWPIGDYVIIYHATVQPLTIARVLHGARDIASLMKKG